jgi:hypothetical protein
MQGLQVGTGNTVGGREEMKRTWHWPSAVFQCGAMLLNPNILARQLHWNASARERNSVAGVGYSGIDEREISGLAASCYPRH